MGAATGFVVVAAAAPASAHVTVDPSTTAAGAHAVLEFSVAHGCGESPTTGLTIQLPPEINAATPTRDALWEVEERLVDLDPPVTDGHGNELTQRVDSVTFTTAQPLVDGVRDTVELSVQLPDAEGTTLVFPVIQTCQGDESAWIEVPGEGLSEDDLELPAPSFTVTAAVGATSDTSDTSEADGTDTTAGGAEQGDGSSGDRVATADESDSLAFVALAAGLLGALLGGAAIALQRRSR